MRSHENLYDIISRFSGSVKFNLNSFQFVHEVIFWQLLKNLNELKCIEMELHTAGSQEDI